MTIPDYARVLREQWLVVAAMVVAGLVVATGVFFLNPVVYTAKLTMYVATQNDASASAAFEGAQLSQQRVTSYLDLATSQRVSQQVVRELGLQESPEEVAGWIAASGSTESVLIDISVTGSPPAQVADIANSAGKALASLVAELERPVGSNAVAPIAVRVVQPATTPTGPSSPGLAILLTLGLVGGLVIGVCGALLRNALDTTVKSPDQLREAAQAPNLGTIAYDASVAKRPLTLHEDPRSSRAEAFRQLRTSLQFVDLDRPRRVLVLTSALPGEGKTTTLCNLAIAMASAGSRVLVVDGDLRRPRLAEILGLERSVGLTNVLSGRLGLEQAIQPWAGGMLNVLASGPVPPNPSELLASRQMVAVLAQLRTEYDVVLIDSPPLLPVTDAAAVAPATDGAILVCKFKKTTRDQVHEAVMALESVAAPVLGTVLTMVPSSGPRAYARYNDQYSGASVDAPVSPAVGTPAVRRAASNPADHRQPRRSTAHPPAARRGSK